MKGPVGLGLAVSFIVLMVSMAASQEMQSRDESGTFVYGAEDLDSKADNFAGFSDLRFQSDEKGAELCSQGFNDSESTLDLGHGIEVRECADHTEDSAESILQGKIRECVSGHSTFSLRQDSGHAGFDAERVCPRGLASMAFGLTFDVDIRSIGDWRIKTSGTAVCDISSESRRFEDEESREDYDVDVGYEWNEVYLQGRLSDAMDLKVGRQIVAWGRSDILQVVDILNPRDFKEPGITAVEDLRLPAGMVRLDYYSENWSVSGISILERRFAELPAYVMEAPLKSIRLDDDTPSRGLDKAELAAVVSGVFSGWDASFYFARYYEKKPHLEIISPGGDPEFHLRYSRQSLVGMDWNVAAGNWLLKGELAVVSGIRFSDELRLQTQSVQVIPGNYSRTDFLLGFEYTGLNDLRLTVEGMVAHVNNYDTAAKAGGVDREDFQLAVGIDRDFLDHTGKLTALMYRCGSGLNDGGFYRLSTEYHMTDNVSVRAGIILYETGDSYLFRNVDGHDSFFLDCTCTF